MNREDAIKKACTLLSEITNYTSVALGPDKSNNRVYEYVLRSLDILEKKKTDKKRPIFNQEKDFLLLMKKQTKIN